MTRSAYFCITRPESQVLLKNVSEQVGVAVTLVRPGGFPPDLLRGTVFPAWAADTEVPGMAFVSREPIGDESIDGPLLGVVVFHLPYRQNGFLFQSFAGLKTSGVSEERDAEEIGLFTHFQSCLSKILLPKKRLVPADRDSIGKHDIAHSKYSFEIQRMLEGGVPVALGPPGVDVLCLLEQKLASEGARLFPDVPRPEPKRHGVTILEVGASLRSVADGENGR